MRRYSHIRWKLIKEICIDETYFETSFSRIIWLLQTLVRQENVHVCYIV